VKKVKEKKVYKQYCERKQERDKKSRQEIIEKGLEYDKRN